MQPWGVNTCTQIIYIVIWELFLNLQPTVSCHALHKGIRSKDDLIKDIYLDTGSQLGNPDQMLPSNITHKYYIFQVSTTFLINQAVVQNTSLEDFWGKSSVNFDLIIHQINAKLCFVKIYISIIFTTYLQCIM